MNTVVSETASTLRVVKVGGNRVEGLSKTRPSVPAAPAIFDDRRMCTFVGDGLLSLTADFVKPLHIVIIFIPSDKQFWIYVDNK